MEELVFTKNLPKKNKIILALLLLRLPLFIPGVKFLVKKHLKHCENIEFFPGFLYYHGNIYAKDVHFGNSFLMDYAPIYIGEGSVLSWDCIIATGHHDPQDFHIIRAKPVKIGKNVQIYARSIILGGVTIGDNVVIGAGSVVTKDIPSDVFAAGNPAKVIKKFT